MHSLLAVFILGFVSRAFGWPPTVLDLADDERIIVEFVTQLPSPDHRREYEILGGSSARIRIYCILGTPQPKQVKRLLGELPLSREDRRGLDTLLNVYRSNFLGGLGASDSVLVGYHKGPAVWGPGEQFEDELRINSRTRSEVIGDLLRFRVFSGTGANWLRSIVTFQELEQRIGKQPKQATEPTP